MSMPRYFVPCSEDELQKHIQDAVDGVSAVVDGWWNPRTLRKLTPAVKKDLDEVDFDWENFECEAFETGNECNTFLDFHTLPSGLTFMGCCAGGDWQTSVWFIYYWSGKEIRAYIPTKGNTFNPKTKKAYGDGENEDSGPNPDYELMFSDIQEHILMEGNPNR